METESIRSSSSGFPGWERKWGLCADEGVSTFDEPADFLMFGEREFGLHGGIWKQEGERGLGGGVCGLAENPPATGSVSADLIQNTALAAPEERVRTILAPGKRAREQFLSSNFNKGANDESDTIYLYSGLEGRDQLSEESWTGMRRVGGHTSRLDAPASLELTDWDCFSFCDEYLLRASRVEANQPILQSGSRNLHSLPHSAHLSQSSRQNFQSLPQFHLSVARFPFQREASTNASDCDRTV
ncbi:hypothetical protein BDK51DRAFT_37418 [Blyttiomyces helicus]|uniref:Uncharacterized protein n=1 Tax=Blyttiomyces helicus TaxID=388810 RepID=A0A4V1IRB5_9FUNG|nr:hypothetical protein BDK51DRAFT_37418 [Blyttiomyces helicus]|eukprot:RKO89477.1 hypothetical protein BDK51DRAFT_37418 [Blyttiomyces helicus]